MTDTASKVNAWENAEDRCYKFLRGILGATHAVDAFKAQLPDGFTFSPKGGMWMFSIGGEAGDKPLDYDWNMGIPGGGDSPTCWVLPAQFQGVWLERPKAIHAAGILRANLPIVESSLSGVYRFKPRREPSVVPGVYELAPDQEDGGKVRVWVLDYPMEVWFTEAEGL